MEGLFALFIQIIRMSILVHILAAFFNFVTFSPVRDVTSCEEAFTWRWLVPWVSRVDTRRDEGARSAWTKGPGWLIDDEAPTPRRDKKDQLLR